MPTTLHTSISCSASDRVRLCALLLALAFSPRAPAADIQAAVLNTDGAPVADAVVVAVPVNAPIPDTRPGVEIVDQVDKEFVPYVKPILVGSEVRFPNKDNIRHQVYSFSPAKRFELPLYAGTPAEPVLFDKPGIVTLGCNIHDWMIGYIYVSESPWFARTGADGRAVISGLPPGQYRLRVWHPLMSGTEADTMREVTVALTPSTVSWRIQLKPDLRPRRSPLGRDQGYR